MKLLFSYSYRNLLARKWTTLMTLLGITLVVFVFAAVLMLEDGLRKTLIATGSPDNFIVIRKSATSDLLSSVGREDARLLETFPEVALSTRDVTVIINLWRYETNDMGNVIVRGVSLNALKLRPQVKIIQGRMWEQGKSEVIVGKSISERFRGCRLGETLKFGGRAWTVTGIFEAQGNGFESEIWADVEQMMQAFQRPVYSTVTLRLNDSSQFWSFKTRMRSEPRLNQLDVKEEQVWYGEQSKMLGNFVKILGLVITGIFSFGAMIGAMITMYSAVANRTTEIGTLRALGFLRRNILLTFLMESSLISVAGGIAGLLLASLLQRVTISMLNFATFSELAFGFDMTADTAIASFIFSITMGLIGGFLPAVRAARLPIVNALRAY